MPLPDPFAAFRLDGKVALVTGARREIGRAIALGLAGAGATVAVHHAGTPEEARDAAAVVAEIGGTARAFAANFAQEDAGSALAQNVLAAFDRVDILVLNASIEIVEPVAAISRETFDKQVTINLWSSVQLVQALLPEMAARGWGRLLTIGSVQQLSPAANMLVYAGSKAMQQNWAVNLARQFSPSGVTVNNLAPGIIATARNADQIAANGPAMQARVPVGRLGTPQDLVGAALLLCSEAGSYINGANLFVDGGRLIS